MFRWLRSLLLLVLFASTAHAGELKVYFFDIGQGDSELIISPTGKTVLIDSGPPDGARALRARLDTLLSAPIDLAILTHPHLDHLGGMEQALASHGAQAFMDSGFQHPSPQYEALLGYLKSHDIKVLNATQGREIDLGGGAVLTLLGPPNPYFSGTRSDPNANSVVARLVYGSERFLFTGDAEEETEQMLIHNGDISADVLKVPHHGSKHSSTAPFLAAVKPKIAVISVGAGNDYGHPRPEALARLREIGATIYRTDQDGEVRIVSDGKHLEVHTGKGKTESTSAAPAPTATESEPAPHVNKHPGKIVKVKHTEVAAESDGYIASRSSKVFHRASCREATSIKPENRVAFADRKSALASGREPAKDCKP